MRAVNMEYHKKLSAFTDLIAAQAPHPRKVEVLVGRTFDRVLIDDGVRYFIEKTSNTIYGARSYTAVNKNWWFGTLDTIADWDWSGYHGKPHADAGVVIVKEYGGYKQYRAAPAVASFPRAEVDHDNGHS